MSGVIDYVVNNWAGIFVAITAVVTAASAIANLTPTDSDNKVIAMISKWVDMLALNFKK